MPNISNIFVDNFCGSQLFIDIMQDCGENAGGLYCRIYDKSRFIMDGTDKEQYPVPIDFGDYLDDFCIRPTDCSMKYSDIISYILKYVQVNISENDLQVSRKKDLAR